MTASLETGSAHEDPAEALAWLERQGTSLGPWVAGCSPAGGEPTLDCVNPATGKALAQLVLATPADTAAAIAATRAAQSDWASRSPQERARTLRALGKAVARDGRRLGLLQTLATGVPIAHGLDLHLPHLIASLDRAAMLSLGASRSDRAPHGVCAVLPNAGAPLASLAALAVPALAAGNGVLLAADSASLPCLNAFAETAEGAGLPVGLLSVLPGDDTILLGSAGIDLVALAATAPRARSLGQAAAGMGARILHRPVGRAAHIVLADADLDSAVEGLVSALCKDLGHGRGALAIVQESVADDFEARLRERMARLRRGDPLEPTTELAPGNTAIASYEALADPGSVWKANPESGAAVISGVDPSDPVFDLQDPAPVIVTTTARTAAEAAAIARAAGQLPSATVWTESVTDALALARALPAEAIGINAPAGEGSTDFDRDAAWTRTHGQRPALGATPASVARTTQPNVIARSLEAARRAQPGWAALPVAARMEAVHGLAGFLPPGPEVDAALRYAMALVMPGAQPLPASDAETLSLVLREPRGVLAIVCSEEDARAAALAALTAGLVAGNTCVLAPSGAEGAIALTTLAAELDSAGPPAGVATVLTAAPAGTAELLTGAIRPDGLWWVAASPPDAQTSRAAAEALIPLIVEPVSEADGFVDAVTTRRAIRLPHGPLL